MDEQQYYDLMEKLEEIDRKFEEYNTRISKLEWESLKGAAKGSEEKKEVPGEKDLVKIEKEKEIEVVVKVSDFDIESILLQTGITICFLGIIFFATMGMQNTLNQVIAILIVGLIFLAASFGCRWIFKK